MSCTKVPSVLLYLAKMRFLLLSISLILHVVSAGDRPDHSFLCYPGWPSETHRYGPPPGWTEGGKSDPGVPQSRVMLLTFDLSLTHDRADTGWLALRRQIAYEAEHV